MQISYLEEQAPITVLQNVWKHNYIIVLALTEWSMRLTSSLLIEELIS